MLLFILLIIRNLTSADVHSESEKLRLLGAQYLSGRNINEAIRALQKSLEIDERNYMSQFLLATAYLTANDATSAKRHLNALLKYKSNFVAARILLAEVLLREAQFDNARDQLYKVLNLDENNEKALTKIEVIKNIEARYNEAAKYMHRKDYKLALKILDELVTECDLSPALFEMRADVHMIHGNYDEALADLKRSAAYDTKNTNMLLRISQLYFNLGEANDSIKWVRNCLRQDPDNNLCFNHYKILKPIVASLNKVHVFDTEEKWKECYDEIQKTLKIPNMSPALVRKCRQTACKCSLSVNDASETVKICTQALETDSMHVDTLINRAEAYILLEKYDDALRDYNDARKYEKSNRIDEGITRIQRLKASGKKRDYYKILGVPRTATKEQIGRAYRKLARKWHPDHYEGTDRAKAESKFKDIADAKEVLSDPEKRREFDDGRDPLNPAEQSSQGFYPFSAQDFQPFGQGFTFRFHFG